MEQTVLKKRSVRTLRKQAKFLQVLEDQFGNITMACKTLKISRSCYYHWIEDFPDFKDKVINTDYDEIKLDFAESKLIQNISKGKEASVIFFMKTKGRKRGYQEHLDMTLKGRLQNLVSQEMSQEELAAFNKALEESV